MTAKNKNIITGDGSVTFFNSEFKEHYHSLDGAHEEALAKYISPSRFEDRFAAGKVFILDVCFGLGYNTLLAAEEAVRYAGKLDVTALEIDKAVVGEAAKYVDEPSSTLNWQKIRAEIYNNAAYSSDLIDIRMLWADARKSCTELINQSRQYDLIYHDPFSTQRNSQLWTVDFFRKLYQLLKPGGVLLTYSTALPVLIGFSEAGFCIGKSKQIGEQRVGTVSAKSLAALSNPYSEEYLNEIMALPKAIPYRDLSQDGSNNEILKERNEKIVELVKREKII